MKKSSLLLAALVLMGAGCLQAKADITSFEECAVAGNPVMESYPRQCRAGGKTFVETVTPAPEPPSANDSSGQEVTLKKGETRTFESGLKVTLAAIEDSRCPKDVQCVWAGELAALLSVGLSAPGPALVEVRLGQTTKPKGEAYGYAFDLVSIDETSAMIAVTKL